MSIIRRIVYEGLGIGPCLLILWYSYISLQYFHFTVSFIPCIIDPKCCTFELYFISFSVSHFLTILHLLSFRALMLVWHESPEVVCALWDPSRPEFGSGPRTSVVKSSPLAIIVWLRRQLRFSGKHAARRIVQLKTR